MERSKKGKQNDAKMNRDWKKCTSDTVGDNGRHEGATQWKPPKG